MIKITIPGIPVPQARMKHCNSNGYVTTYDPRAKEKKDIRSFLLSQNIEKLSEFPCVSFIFHMPIPQSISKKQEDLYNSGYVKHDKRPDVDNLVKLYLDCLDGIAFEGDQKIWLGPCLKIYHPEPKTIIFLQESNRIFSSDDLHFDMLFSLAC